jgi:hypothetical protein
MGVILDSHAHFFLPRKHCASRDLYTWDRLYYKSV